MPTTLPLGRPGTTRRTGSRSGRSRALRNIALSPTLSALVMLTLRSMGSGVLGLPPTGFQNEDLGRWLIERPPLDVTLALARGLTFVVAAGTFTVCVAAVVEGIWLRRGQGRTGCLPLPSTVRRWRDAAFALSIVVPTCVLASPATGQAATGERPAGSAARRPTLAAILRTAGDPGSGQRWPSFDDPSRSSDLRTTSSNTSSTTSTTRLGASEKTGAAVPAIAVRVTSRQADSAPNPNPDRSVRPGIPDDPAQASTYVVRVGDSFWSIAEHAALVRNPTASDDDVAAHWLRVVQLNRGMLHDPSNPDLIRPGETVLVPGWE